MRKSSYKQTAVSNIGSLGSNADLRLVPPDRPSNMALSCLGASPVRSDLWWPHALLRRVETPPTGETR